MKEPVIFTPGQGSPDPHKPEPPWTGPAAGRRWGNWWVGLLVLVLLSPLAYVVARPFYRAEKLKRARALAAEIQSGIGRQSVQELDYKMRLMLSLSPADPEVWRAAARYCASNQLPDALYYQRLLRDQQPDDLAAQLDYVQLAIDMARYDVAAAELERLLKQQPDNPSVLRFALRLAAARRHWPMTVRLAGELLNRLPADGEAQLRLGQALASSGSPEHKAKGRAGLLALAAVPGEWRAEAWRTLLAVPAELTPEETRILLGFLQRSGDTSVEWRLETLNLEMRLEPAIPIAGFATRAVALAGDHSSSATVGAVVRWLLQNGQAPAALELLPFETARADPQLIRLYLATLLKLKRYDEAMKLLNDHETALPKHLVRASLALIVGRGKTTFETEQEFVRAIEPYLREANALLELAELAETEGLYEGALAAWEPLLRIPRLMPAVANRMLALAEHAPLLAPRRNPLRRLLDAYPDDRVVLLELAYVTSVLGPPDPALIARLRDQTDLPDPQLAQAVISLAEAKTDHADTALDRLDRLSVNWDQAPVRLLIIRAFVLRQALRPREAEQAARQAEKAGLLAEEKRLLSPILSAP